MTDIILSKAVVAVFGHKFFTKHPTFNIEKNIEFIAIDDEYYIFVINGVECWILKQNIDNVDDLKLSEWNS